MLYTGYYFSEMCKGYNAKKNLLKKHERSLEVKPFPYEYQLIIDQQLIKKNIEILKEHITWVEETFKKIEEYYGKDIKEEIYSIYVERKPFEDSKQENSLKRIVGTVPFLSLLEGQKVIYNDENMKFISIEKKAEKKLYMNLLNDNNETISVPLSRVRTGIKTNND